MFMKRIAFLGFGNMAGAIAAGMVEKGGVPRSELLACDLERGKVEAFGIDFCPSAAEAAASAKFIFLCVKPQQIMDLAQQIAPFLSEEKVLVSIAAGVTADALREATGYRCPVVRVLPNLPLMAGFGTTAIARPDGISDEDYNTVFRIFDGIGSAVEIDPSKFNEVIPVSSSSPAFLFEMARLTACCAGQYGIPEENALKLFAGTMKGCAEMMLKGERTPEQLTQMVCSKKGTTEAALEAMREMGWEEAFIAGFKRCIERAYELGR